MKPVKPEKASTVLAPDGFPRRRPAKNTTHGHEGETLTDTADGERERGNFRTHLRVGM